MSPRAKADLLVELVKFIRSRPRSDESMASTWNPPDWEEIVGWWDEAKEIVAKFDGGKA